jgi:hypothetical protein
LLIILWIVAIGAWAQQDPGPRPGPATAGGPYPTLNANEQAFFSQAFLRFQEVDSVSGTEKGSGLGPTFNGNSCAMCHAQPLLGGSSPGLSSPQSPVPNPQVALATLDGAANTVPPFITANGPVREARFVRGANGSLDGGVHGLYTIAGRTDAPGCTLAQPNFAQQLAANNVIFRIPTPLFGLGLVENTPDATLQANLAATQSARSQLGIGGTFNTSGNDGTITRFGWKAQNKSLLMFAGEAYNVEQGVATELFPNERSAVPGCVFNPTPEDYSNILNGNPNSPNYNTSLGTVSEMSSDIVNFAAFMRLSAPATPAPPTPSTDQWLEPVQQHWMRSVPLPVSDLGCVSLHRHGRSNLPAILGFRAPPYGLRSGGWHQSRRGGPDQFRTAPLWGVGQRLFFLHDGRTSDLLQAIKDHSSGGGCQSAHIHQASHQVSEQACGSEADTVIQNFKLLSPSQIQDLLNFLRSL